MHLNASELILNADQSIYHLHLLPEDIADTIITVGDPERVQQVSNYFDTISLRKQNREFITHTGICKGKPLTVVSTGIGTDNIDIVLNELDALVNIDFETRTALPVSRSLNLIRIGSSGAIQEDIPVDSFLLSEYAIGLDNLLHFYQSEHIQHPQMQLAFMDHMNWSAYKAVPYVVESDLRLTEQLTSAQILLGFTATNAGFYAPQGRNLRLPPEDENLGAKLAAFEYEGRKITNLEMETAGIYGLSRLLGHRAVSLNCILANRSTGEFSKEPDKAMDRLIRYVLGKLCI